MYCIVEEAEEVDDEAVRQEEAEAEASSRSDLSLVVIRLGMLAMYTRGTKSSIFWNATDPTVCNFSQLVREREKLKFPAGMACVCDELEFDKMSWLIVRVFSNDKALLIAASTRGRMQISQGSIDPAASVRLRASSARIEPTGGGEEAQEVSGFASSQRSATAVRAVRHLPVLASSRQVMEEHSARVCCSLEFLTTKKRRVSLNSDMELPAARTIEMLDKSALHVASPSVNCSLGVMPSSRKIGRHLCKSASLHLAQAGEQPRPGMRSWSVAEQTLQGRGWTDCSPVMVTDEPPKIGAEGERVKESLL
mmetsp:Transcript_3432/g.8373  ORF Transcript_3432/g.8373 Transcript_3432/m.8373 type:complete len:308 (-) Transcript_3432:4464-5387(-)